MIYWITGRSGSGKTTLARKMAKEFREKGNPVLVLDGEEVRNIFPTGFSDEERYNHIMRIAKIASFVEKQKTIVIIALISPMRCWRMEARKLFRESKLIYLSGGTMWIGTKYEEPTEEELN